ncbi:mechanosensitive ion channel family protein [Acaryochloris sp. CCMEE 5410]|uniref:mechanosensitive ion channel family protein n=1 Tax=Acaryochloris sp. CCMEE 5410 TaxID=310037 RepID=UPI0002484CC2|nr:mechanosensitive ion channel domain-containing protein [Acaryochloris sp. CCMEE 5410]KAI9132325.1 mechanosensitive ion channel [Acaryochloris sp. CCMEE 5410]
MADLTRILLEAFEVDGSLREFLIELGLRVGLFAVGVVLSPLVGRILPFLIWWLLRLINRFIPLGISKTYGEFIRPVRNSLITTGTFGFIALCANLLRRYEGFYKFLGLFIYLALAISMAWLASRLAQRVIRLYVVNLVQRLGVEVNELVLIIETLVNILIVLFSVVIFAQGLELNLLALSASIGLGGVGVAFAAKEALEQLVGTIELYLDRPYLPGEYIRVNFNPHNEDVYGRIESIGLRSTKIRTVARNTVYVVPNAIMANKEIENITRGKKVMAMLFLNFPQVLKTSEEALVKRIVVESIDNFGGVDKSSTRVRFSQTEEKNTRARVNFFIMGSSEDSLRLRKLLIELANETISTELLAYGLRFTMPEPMVYIDSPMTI